jgi:small-conductance mechanosensitive channel/CRP-like cAMP-binding protein
MSSNINFFDAVTNPAIQTGVLAAVGALVTRVLLRGHPKRRFVGQLGFFLALTALLFYHGIVPYQPNPPNVSTLEHVFIAIAKIIWWINAAWTLVEVGRVFLIFEGQPRAGRFLQDLVAGIIYLGAILSVVAYVFNFPVGTLIATSGAVAIVLGLALQSTLADVFSGIALNLSRPYGVGDWLVLSDGIEGKVVETNWRATHLLTGANDLVIVPNSDLAKARLTNLSGPEPSHGVTLAIRFQPTTAPSAIVNVMRSVLQSSNSIMDKPEPTVQVISMDANAVALELSFRVATIAAVGKARSEIFDLIYRHAKAAGLVLSPGPEQVGAALAKADELQLGHHTTARRLLDAIALFASMTEDEREALAATMTRRTFRKGEVLAEQGAVLESLMVVRNGIVAVVRREATHETEVGRLAPGDFFGEGGLLTGAGEFGSIVALTFVVVYEIRQEGLAPLLQDRPAIADELAALLSRRNAAELFKIEQLHGGVAEKSVPRLKERIRQLFDL